MLYKDSDFKNAQLTMQKLFPEPTPYEIPNLKLNIFDFFADTSNQSIATTSIPNFNLLKTKPSSTLPSTPKANLPKTRGGQNQRDMAKNTLDLKLL